LRTPLFECFVVVTGFKRIKKRATTYYLAASSSTRGVCGIAAIREIIYIHHEFLYNSSQPRIVSGHDDLDIALLLEEGGMDGWWTGAGWFVEKKIACLVASQS
jgi:hypothetical protein